MKSASCPTVTRCSNHLCAHRTSTSSLPALHGGSKHSLGDTLMVMRVQLSPSLAVK